MVDFLCRFAATKLVIHLVGNCCPIQLYLDLRRKNGS